MDDEYESGSALDEQMKKLLADIEKEPVSEGLIALAAQLQKLLNERNALAEQSED